MIEILPQSKDNTVGFKVTTPISLEDLQQIEPKLNQLIEQYGKINWLIILDGSFPYYSSWRAFYEDMMWVTKHLKNFGKMAVVGHNPILKTLIKVDGLIFGERYYDISDLDEAWKYINS